MDSGNSVIKNEKKETKGSSTYQLTPDGGGGGWKILSARQLGGGGSGKNVS
jgi:hypothetical protein